MFKKPFDKVKGETRVCKECGNNFHTFKPVYKCKPCQCKKQIQIHQRKKDAGLIELKNPYPYVKIGSTGRREYVGRFKSLQSKLNKIKERDKWKEYLSQRLDEVMGDEVLMKWIFDRRDNETKRANKNKTKNLTIKDYPDTRGYYD